MTNKERSKNIRRLVIILILVFIVLIGAGIAYAYYVSQLAEEGEKETFTASTAILGNVTFDNGATLTLENAFPGAVDTKNFTVKADANSTATLDYTVYLNVENNTFTTSNLKYKVTASTDGGDKGGSVESKYSNLTVIDSEGYKSGNKIAIGTGTLGKDGTVDTWTVELTLVNAETEQNDDQGKQFSATLSVESGKAE